ncbi:acetylglucosamine-6-sulfatase [Polaribacter reichenbachii]|uniref:Acetylglucosamine-6-sulfatase n=1 Tax=Polaribacter reichenbachii TaxID=996801 RepID=A0A1B8TUQ4_9FLAO|nr:sulfatase-like hydrolase/transferase [Polaribacter reichenbachii]APZ45562.1 acetylglucosamine-6-sulfatase [Polaribacter reichenbachii]AUC19424.1 acetylglucosamine-6-sulfatase [Polaribacter reichenbachii]OBY63421.1 acetylglucosamine-6-sulfatase [Polaribacter reichenbachii]
MKFLSKKNVLQLLLVGLSISYVAQEKPNIVFILTDDQSYGMMGATGNNIVQTPNIDQLAKEGTLFTNTHITSAICTPSRISILLSQYERKHGVNFNSGTSVSDEAWQKSYPVVMRNAGYYTGWIGKNHAPIGEGGYTSGLMEKSFDYWYAGHGHIRFYPKQVHEIFNDAIAHTQPEIINESVDDFLDPNARKLKGAVKFLEVRPKDKPFLLSINFNLPHGAGTSTMQLKKNDDDIYKTLYRDLDIPLPKNYIAKKDIKTPKLPADLLRTEDRQTGYNHSDTPEGFKERYIRQMQAMTGIDRMIGNLRAKLKELKIDKNTIIIFTSDHGLFMGEQGLGGKALCYEKTTHVPLIIMNPKVKRKHKGLKTDALVQSIDVAPTILTFAGVQVPEEFQGKDISHLTEDSSKEIRKYVFTENLWSTHFGNPKCEAVQTKDWKYIRYYKNTTRSASKEIEVAKSIGMPVNKMLYAVHDPDIAYYRSLSDSSLEGEEPVYEELYHLKNDANELTNLAYEKQYQAKLAEMRAAWQVEIKAARGVGKPKVLRYTNDSHPNGGH